MNNQLKLRSHESLRTQSEYSQRLPTVFDPASVTAKGGLFNAPSRFVDGIFPKALTNAVDSNAQANLKAQAVNAGRTPAGMDRD